MSDDVLLKFSLYCYIVRKRMETMAIIIVGKGYICVMVGLVAERRINDGMGAYWELQARLQHYVRLASPSPMTETP